MWKAVVLSTDELMNLFLSSESHVERGILMVNNYELKLNCIETILETFRSHSFQRNRKRERSM